MKKPFHSSLALIFLALSLAACGNTSSSGPTGGGGGGGTSITAPANVGASAGNTRVMVHWRAVSGATSYTVYYRNAAGVTKANGVKVASAASGQPITGLANGTTYHFVVTASDFSSESAVSAEVSATPVSSIAGNAAYAPNDTLYADQWHLKNTGQTGATGVPGTAGEDLNVEKVWTTHKGGGQRIAIVDDGLDILHEDLAANVIKSDSWDYLTNTAPATNLITGNNAHGTACAGLAAGVGNNGKGIVGVAMDAELVGYNFLQTYTAADEADAMTRGQSTNSVYSNSWGAPDNTGTLQPPSATWESAVTDGITNGRGGKGSIYTWAAGNGWPNDRSDYDGQANSHNVIAVAALNDTGAYSSYSEQGSNLLVSAYGGEFCNSHALTTTDITGAAGENNNGVNTNGYTDLPDSNYTKCMNGTSGATPQVSGVVALMLEANPNLTYRDVRLILATTARKNDPTEQSWGQNGAGLHINQNYGYGAVDTLAAVNAALTWTSVGGATSLVTKSGSKATAVPIPDGAGTAANPAYGAPATSTITLAGSGISKIEFVDVTVAANHAEFGDLKITLTSPMLTSSTLVIPHVCSGTTGLCGASSDLTAGFRFNVARLINETADGDWILSVSDGRAGNTGSLTSWSITVYGH